MLYLLVLGGVNANVAPRIPVYLKGVNDWVCEAICSWLLLSKTSASYINQHALRVKLMSEEVKEPMKKLWHRKLTPDTTLKQWQVLILN